MYSIQRISKFVKAPYCKARLLAKNAKVIRVNCVSALCIPAPHERLHAVFCSVLRFLPTANRYKESNLRLQKKRIALKPCHHIDTTKTNYLVYPASHPRGHTSAAFLGVTADSVGLAHPPPHEPVTSAIAHHRYHQPGSYERKTYKL